MKRAARRMAALLLAALPLAGCGFPRDPDHTRDRVLATRRVRVGVIAAGDDRRGIEAMRAFVVRLSAETGAVPVVTSGAAEPLLARLEAGMLDVVVGRFAETSPWETRVTLTEPLVLLPEERGRGREVAAVRNGENAWLMLVDRVARGGR